MKKFLFFIILLFFVSNVYADGTNLMKKISEDCKQLGFEEGSKESANCKLELLVLEKKLDLEKQKVKLSEAEIEVAKESARAAEANARANRSIANSERWRNNRRLMKQGQRMLSGACTLGVNC